MRNQLDVSLCANLPGASDGGVLRLEGGRRGVGGLGVGGGVETRGVRRSASGTMPSRTSRSEPGFHVVLMLASVLGANLTAGRLLPPELTCAAGELAGRMLAHVSDAKTQTRPL
jgi:hypothetical protein